MSCINTTKHGQFVLQFYVSTNGVLLRFQHAFKTEEEALEQQVLVDREIAKYKHSKKLTPYLKSLIVAKEAKPKRQMEGSGIRIAELFERFLSEKEIYIKKISVKTYREAFNDFIATVGNVRIKEVTRDTINVYIKARQKTVSNVTINKRIRHIKTGFRYADAEGHLDKNPFNRKFDELRIDRKRKAFLKYHEFVHLLNVAMDRGRNQHLYIAIGVYSGLRASEIHRLKWNDLVNFKASHDKCLKDTLKRMDKTLGTKSPAEKNYLLTILNRIVQEYVDESIGTMPYDELKKRHPDIYYMVSDIAPRNSYILVRKSKTGAQRHIPIFPELETILRAYYPAVESDWDDHIVKPKAKEFLDDIRDYRFDHGWLLKNTLKQAGLTTVNRWGANDPVGSHTFRYTFVSWCLGRGYDIDTVRRWVGHTTKEMTEHYGYLQPDKIDFLTAHSQTNGRPSPQLAPEEHAEPTRKASKKRMVTSLMQHSGVIIDGKEKGK